MRKVIETMRSFSGGQINVGAKRRDDAEEYKTGAAVMSDWRLETMDTLVPRPGRRLLTSTGSPRIEYARLGSTDYAIAFGTSGGVGQTTIYDLASMQPVASQASSVYAWNLSTVDLIYFCVCDFQIVVCYPGMRPQLAVRTPTTGAWTFGQFAFRTITGQSQQPFYRTGQLGSLMSYSALHGACVLQCTAPYFTQAMVGNILSLMGQQATITGVQDPYTADGAIATRLPTGVLIGVDSPSAFLAGQLAQISGSGSLEIEITTVTPIFQATVAGQNSPTRANITGVIKSSVSNTYVFTYGDIITTESGNANINGFALSGQAETTEWQEQFMGDGLGWPQACAYDKGRLIFFDFPQKPEAILWSAVGEYDVFWVDQAAAFLQSAAGADPSSAILDFIPEEPRVRHVVGWGDEFVFTDKGIYEIPIQATSNPLQPGSVEFRQFSNDGVSPLVPQKTQDSIIYVNAGGTRASVVIRTGSYTNPYTSDGASELHTDLFTGPVVMTVAPGDGVNPERLVYILNADGSIISGKFTRDRKFVGWQPWYSAAAPTWLFCSGPDVYFCEPHAGTYWLAREDESLFVDGAVTPNALPSGFPGAPAGKGPLWMLAGQVATLTDQGVDKGDRQIDANGNIITQQGDVWTSPTLVAGLLFTPKLQPFVPATPPGESVGQRQHRRKISRAMVSAEVSSGFVLGSRTFAGTGSDQTEQVRPIGRSFDPGCLLVKARPGPLRVVEYSTEVTI